VYLAFILKCTSDNIYADFPSISEVDIFPKIGFDKLMVLKSDPTKKNEMLSIIESYVESGLAEYIM
jgi:hypothetical protein